RPLLDLSGAPYAQRRHRCLRNGFGRCVYGGGVPNQYEDLVQQAMRDFSDALDRADDVVADRVSPVPRTTAGPDEDVDGAAPPPPGQPAPATPGQRARSEPYGSLAGLGSGQ